MSISGCSSVSGGESPHVVGLSKPPSCAETYFEVLMHKQYVEKKADVIDDSVFDILCAAENKSLELLQRRSNKLKDPKNLALVLKTVGCIAIGQQKKDKADWIATRLKNLNVCLGPDDVFNKKREQVSKKADCESTWWKTAIKCAILALVVLSGVAILSKMIQAPRAQAERCGPQVEMPELPVCSIGEVAGYNFAENPFSRAQTEARSPKIEVPKIPICSIDMVTAHNFGNTTENKALNLAIETQERYAERHGYSHTVFSENRATECVDFHGATKECDPEWSTIEIIRNWLQQSKNPCEGESWLAFLDKNVVVTNCVEKEAELKNIIGVLRETGQVSMIVTSDFFSKGAIDTGALFVRHDNAAKEVIESIWKARNDKTNRETLGICPSKVCKHEQEAITNILQEHPELYTDFFRNYPGSSDNPLEWPDNTTIFVIPYRVQPIPGINVPAFSYNKREIEFWRRGDFSGRCPSDAGGITLDCVKGLIKQSRDFDLC